MLKHIRLKVMVLLVICQLLEKQFGERSETLLALIIEKKLYPGNVDFSK